MKRQYTDEQKARIKERGAVYRLAHKDQIRAHGKARYAAIRSSPELVEKERARSRAYAKERYESSPAEILAKGAKWRAENKDKAKASYTKYREENREKVRLSVKARYDADPEKMKQCVARWQANNQKKVKEDHSAWGKRNRDKTRVYNHNRRLRVGDGVLSAGIVKRLGAMQKWKCACCNADLTKEAYHLDHMMPLALGGENIDANMQLICVPCNLSKHAKHPINFMQSRGMLL